MKNKLWFLLGCLSFVVVLGCGTPKNTVEIPENPEPLPPGGLQLQSADADEGPSRQSTQAAEFPAP
jgi:hypothetical protein